MKHQITEFAMIRGIGAGLITFMLPKSFMVSYQYFRLVPMLDDYSSMVEFELFDFNLNIICYN
jgi:hypothetical protein